MSTNEPGSARAPSELKISLAKRLAQARDHGGRRIEPNSKGRTSLASCRNLTSPRREPMRRPHAQCHRRFRVHIANPCSGPLFASDIFERSPTSLSRHSTSWTAKLYLPYGPNQGIGTSIPAARSADPQARRSQDAFTSSD
jgi:hypothetical protein